MRAVWIERIVQERTSAQKESLFSGSKSFRTLTRIQFPAPGEGTLERHISDHGTDGRSIVTRKTLLIAISAKIARIAKIEDRCVAPQVKLTAI